ncbi:2-oxoglutarate and iron-dependent oxygenase domain-containing protein 2-like [Argonauta hians]
MFYNCGCYFYRNIFLSKYGMHITYKGESSFKNLYGETLRQKGCDTGEKFDEVLREIEDEIQRRRTLNIQSTDRRKMIETDYQRLHPNIFTLDESFLDPEFLKIIEICKSGGALEVDALKKQLCVNKPFQLYEFPVFTEEFCKLLLEELDNFNDSDLPKGRPNSMNNFGCSLDELGLDVELLDPLRNYLSSITSTLFPKDGGSTLDSQKVFTVEYSEDKDKKLDTHFDNSEITLNVCLGKTFTGGELFFRGRLSEMYETAPFVYTNRPRYGILHRGAQLHGAHPIKSGTRCNLIMWMRASSVRNKRCPMCNDTPQLEEDPSSGYGQGFTCI